MQIKSPFTEEQVKALNEYQQLSGWHPFTCCGHNGCERNETNNWGTLIAAANGWVCPCGNYTQDWAHEFMTKSITELQVIMRYPDAYARKYAALSMVIWCPLLNCRLSGFFHTEKEAWEDALNWINKNKL